MRRGFSAPTYWLPEAATKAKILVRSLESKPVFLNRSADGCPLWARCGFHTVTTMGPIVAGNVITRWKIAGAFALGTSLSGPGLDRFTVRRKTRRMIVSLMVFSK
jgi:hypothetical protein